MIAIDEFIPMTAPSLPGCPDFSIKLALAAAASEFCARSLVWRIDADEDQTTAGESVFQYGGLTGSIVKVISLEMDGAELEQVGDRDQSINAGAETGKPTKFAFVEDDSIRFYPSPDGTYSFKAFLALKPALSATRIERFLYERWGEYIASGAMYRLMQIPGKEWSNPGLAAFHLDRFERGIGKAGANEASKVRARVKPHYF